MIALRVGNTVDMQSMTRVCRSLAATMSNPFGWPPGVWGALTMMRSLQADVRSRTCNYLFLHSLCTTCGDFRVETCALVAQCRTPFQCCNCKNGAVLHAKMNLPKRRWDFFLPMSLLAQMSKLHCERGLRIATVSGADRTNGHTRIVADPMDLVLRPLYTWNDISTTLRWTNCMYDEQHIAYCYLQDEYMGRKRAHYACDQVFCGATIDLRSASGEIQKSLTCYLLCDICKVSAIYYLWGETQSSACCRANICLYCRYHEGAVAAPERCANADCDNAVCRVCAPLCEECASSDSSDENHW